MATLKQSELDHRIEMFVTNGRTAEAQALLTQVGYDLPRLDEGMAMLQAWRITKTQRQTLLAAQKEATKGEQKARRAAQQEVVNFSETIRILFGSDELVLTSLGLYKPRATSNGANGDTMAEDGSESTRSTKASSSTAAMIERWRLLFTNGKSLKPEHLEQLVLAGWDAVRIDAALVLVEAYSSADTIQQQSIRSYEAERTAAREAEAALREWYRQARRLCKLAVKKMDPDNREKLFRLLGL